MRFCFWRRRRDLNPRAAFTTYTLSRGASSANLSTSPNLKHMKLWRQAIERKSGGEAEIRTLGAFASLVFKTSSLNHSDTSPSTCRAASVRLKKYIMLHEKCQGFFGNFLRKISCSGKSRRIFIKELSFLKKIMKST